MKTGFIYLWKDTEKNKYYIGSHVGSINDGYVGSGKFFFRAYKKRPHAFKRRILENNIPQDQIKEREEYWLSMIDDQELGVRYYNLKKVAFGGDIISTLTEEAKEQHKIKSGIASKKYWDSISKEEYENRKKTAFGGNAFDREYLRERNKKLCSKIAIVNTPNGETIEIKNVAEFCRNNNLNYGNFKTMLRGNGAQKSVSGYTGAYV